MAASQPLICTRVISPASFPFDPRYEQTRCPLNSIHPCSRENRFGSGSRLLRLPDEILAHITRCLAEIDQGHHLPNFALTHSQCRQLARPFQFADVWIMESEQAWSFLRFLKDEDIKSGTLPSIGSCIRYLTFTFSPDFTQWVDYSPEYKGWDEASERWYDHWRGMVFDLAQVIQHKLPILEHVHWQEVDDQLYYVDSEGDPANELDLMPVILGKATSAGRVRTLYLEDDSLFIDGNGLARSLFPTKGLLNLTDLAIGSSRFESSDGSFPETTYFHETILRKSAESLESLAFNPSLRTDFEADDDAKYLMTFRDGRILFPRMRKFWSFHCTYQKLHHDVVQSFLSADLESFAPSPEICSVMAKKRLVEKYPMPHLRTFAVVGNDSDREDHPEHVDTCLQLAQAYGHQLEELFIYLGEEDSPEGEVISSHIVTHISSGNFVNLQSLCFAWSLDQDLRVFKTVAQCLPALQELSFGFEPLIDQTGCRMDGLADSGWQHNYKLGVQSAMPSHSDLKAALSPLRNLERLCIFGDEYVADFAGKGWAWHRFMKEHVWFHQGRSNTQREKGILAFSGQPWSEGKRGHKRLGNNVPDWVTPFLTGLTPDTLKAAASAEEIQQAAQNLSVEYAKLFPKLRELIVGRVLVEVMYRDARN